MDERKLAEVFLGDYFEDVHRCIRCGFCNTVCPTSNSPLSYMSSRTARGRMVMLQAYFSGVMKKSLRDRGFQALLDYCFGCRRCLDICPPGVRIPQVMWRAKGLGGRHGLLKGAIYGNYGSFEKICSTLPGLSNYVLKSAVGKVLLELLTGIDRRVEFPRFSGLSLQRWISKNSSGEGGGRRLAYFIDVFTNYHEVDLGMDVVRFLRGLGYSVEAPPQREAGTLLLEAGMIGRVVKVARENVESLYRAAASGARILTSSPAAYLALKKDYPEILGDSKAKFVADSTVDVLELVMEEYETGRVSFNVRSDTEMIAYHHSCFTKASGLTRLIRELLSIAGYRLVELDECCGIGGVWGMMRRHYDESMAVGKRLLEKLRKLGLPIASQSETCRLRIASSVPTRAEHPFLYVSRRAKIQRGRSQS